MTLGIWGYGGIGRQTARLAKAIGLEVHVLSRRGIHNRENVFCIPGIGDPEGLLPDKVYLRGQEREFLSKLDFLLLSMPLTPETEGIVGRDELQALPNNSFILNPARGSLTQESALIQALQEGWIAGAALDTHHDDILPSDHPFWRMRNVIITPHISGTFESPYTMERIWDIFIQNVERFTSGKPLLNELSPEQLGGN